MSLEVFFRHVIARFKAGKYTQKDLLSWFSQDGSDGSESTEGSSYSHRLLREVSAENTQLIKWMFSFVADATEGEIFSFLMTRDLAGNTLGHVVCSQDFCEKHDVMASGLFHYFLCCMGKLSTSLCRPDFIAAKNQLGFNLDDVIRESRVDIVKQAYYRFQAPIDGVSILPIHSNQSAFMPQAKPLQIKVSKTKENKEDIPPSISRARCKQQANNRFFDSATISAALSGSSDSDVPPAPTSLKTPSANRKRISVQTLSNDGRALEGEKFSPI